VRTTRKLKVLATHSITVARTAAGFVFVALAGIPGKEIAAGVVYLSAIVADVVDGLVARRLAVNSQFGAALDVTADRLVTVSSVVLFTSCGFPSVACGLLLVRDTVISGLRAIHVDVVPLVRSNRKIGAPTAMPIKILTFMVLAYNRWGW
jgi:CDP-diacylglycerol--glycerol-3-phosphate 3-phosphatidyltransferase